jgi:hypothetical protein
MHLRELFALYDFAFNFIQATFIVSQVELYKYVDKKHLLH